MDRQDALRQIAEIVGPEGIVPPAEAERYLVDERRLYRGSAALIVRPRTVGECSPILAICNRARPCGGPPGGNPGGCRRAPPCGAQCHVRAVMPRVIQRRLTAPVRFPRTAAPGVALAHAYADAAKHGLLFGVKIVAAGSYRIGGNVA